eukprot:6364143-Prymnesium_polylepis.1
MVKPYKPTLAMVYGRRGGHKGPNQGVTCCLPSNIHHKTPGRTRRTRRTTVSDAPDVPDVQTCPDVPRRAQTPYAHGLQAQTL